MSSKDGLKNLRLSAVDYAGRLWDWSGLNEAFKQATGRPIKQGDIDGFTEVNGRFLFVEGKPVGADLSNGQGRALSRLNNLEEVTVVIVEGEPPNKIEKWYVIDSNVTYPGNYDGFANWVYSWAESAEDKKGKKVPGAKPLYRFYIAGEDGKINFKDEAFAVWESVTRDGNKTYLSGKMKDGRKVQGWPVVDKPDSGQQQADHQPQTDEQPF